MIPWCIFSWKIQDIQLKNSINLSKFNKEAVTKQKPKKSLPKGKYLQKEK